jgi:hypothetical protein
MPRSIASATASAIDIMDQSGRTAFDIDVSTAVPADPVGDKGRATAEMPIALFAPAAATLITAWTIIAAAIATPVIIAVAVARIAISVAIPAMTMAITISVAVAGMEHGLGGAGLFGLGGARVLRR